MAFPAEVVCPWGGIRSEFTVTGIERFEAAGLQYEVSDRTKSEIYKELLGPMNSGKVELLDHPQMIAELLNLERRVARGGRDSIDHPAGLHDDSINAVAGAIVLVAGRPRFASAGLFELYRERAAALGVPSAIAAGAGTVTRPHLGHPDAATAADRPEPGPARCPHGALTAGYCRICCGVSGLSRGVRLWH